MNRSNIKVTDHGQPFSPDNGRSLQDAETDVADDTSVPGRSFGLREAIIISFVSCAAAVAVSWLHL